MIKRYINTYHYIKSFVQEDIITSIFLRVNLQLEKTLILKEELRVPPTLIQQIIHQSIEYRIINIYIARFLKI